MSQTKEQIKANISRNITTNGVGAITGEVMRRVLNNMTDNLALEKDISDLQSSVEDLSENKVDKVEGKGLSTNDYTTEEKQKLASIDMSIYATKASVEDIKALIPSQASESNQLADKDFVNSTVSTNTASFLGTSATGLSQAEFEAWLGTLSPDVNDYVFWNTTDTDGNVVFKRYKYTGSAWLYEYSLNNSSFTAAQWAAIQSGINSSMVTKLSELPTVTELNNSLNNKVDKVTGMGLSTNDYTTADKNKLAGIAEGAQVNVLEGVKVDGTELPITDKKVDIDLSGKVDVAEHQSQEDQSFVFRQTGGGNLTIDAKNAELTSIKGKSLVWNQLVKNGNFANGTTGWTARRSSITISGEIVTATCTASGDMGFAQSSILTSGHKVLVRIAYKCAKSSVLGIGGTYITKSASEDFTDFDMIVTVGSASSFEYLVASASIGDTLSIDAAKGVVIFDLTLMFGAGNEPSTVEEFEAMFPEAYYPYNAGTLISNDASALETVGFNQWDEETRNGYYNDNGEFVASAGWLCNKNLIPVFENTTYYVQTPTSCKVLAYDANGVFISSIGYFLQKTFTTPAGTRFINFHILNTYGNVYNNDICINLSDASKNGTYEPYWKRTLNLGLNNIRVKSHNIWDEEWESGKYNTSGTKATDATAIRSTDYIPCLPNTVYYIKIPNAANVNFYDARKNFISYLGKNGSGTFTTSTNARYITFYIASTTTYNHDICINISSSFNGNYEPHGVLTKTGGLKGTGSAYDEKSDKYYERIGEVDLGTLNWGYNEGTGYKFVTNIFPGSKLNASMICTLYELYSNIPYSSKRTDIDKKIGICTSANNYWGIYVIDSSYTDNSTFKTAMSGVMLYYELATPIEYELVEPINSTYKVDKLGTEQAIFPTHEDGSPSTPFRADISYSEAHVKYNEVEGMADIINDLSDVMASDASKVGSNGTVATIISLTQAQYNALTTKDPNTVYVIKPSN